jgi:hypothetical protein
VIRAFPSGVAGRTLEGEGEEVRRMPVHCPLCGLYFHYTSELELHAREDHLHEQAEEREEHVTRYRVSGRPKLGPYLKLM